jgi:hypothetical protein
MTETVNVTMGKYVQFVYTMTETVNVTICEYIP